MDFYICTIRYICVREKENFVKLCCRVRNYDWPTHILVNGLHIVEY